MRLTVLGCDGSYPGVNGACSSFLVREGEDSLLLDLGCAALPRLMAVMEPADLRGVIITHWHFDHACDLLGMQYYLLLKHARMGVYSPPEAHPLKALLAPEQYDLFDVEQVPTLGGFALSTMRMKHPTPACAVRLTRGGKSLVYTGDTSSAEGLVDFARGADALIIDATFTRAQWREGAHHFSAAQAGEAARDAGVKRLILSHFQPGSDAARLVAEGREAFPGAVAAAPGMTIEL